MTYREVAPLAESVTRLCTPKCTREQVSWS